MTTYTEFRPPRSVRQYLGQPGSEPNGQLLPWTVLDSHADCVTRSLPEEFVVIGEELHEDGRRFLQFGATTEFIEATTSWRWDGQTRQLRSWCPVCEHWDGKHSKGCTA